MIALPTVALLVAALAAPGSAPRAATGSGLAVATLAVERVALPPGTRPPVLVDAIGRTLVLPTRNPAALLRFLSPRLGRLCPSAEAVTGGVRLHCRTRRLAATVIADRAGPALELRELRGIPWRPGDDGPPRFPWDPAALGGGGCPGVTPAAMGECALGRGETAAAAAHFRAALAGRDRPWAAVRLGDLALAEDRLEDALAHWADAGTIGIFARLAGARICELTGRCLDAPALGPQFDPAGLPWPLDAELALRAARVEAFVDRPGAAAHRLLALLSAERAAGCGWTGTLCRRIALEALREARGPDREEALALYLSLPEHDRGPLAVELARGGAEAAAGLGAPIFGGNLLAAVAARVPPAEQSGHLLRAAELFVAGGDPVRAGVILEFARTRLAAARLSEPRWAAIVTAVTAGANAPAPAPVAAPDPDLDRARIAVERARHATTPAR